MAKQREAPPHVGGAEVKPGSNWSSLKKTLKPSRVTPKYGSKPRPSYPAKSPALEEPSAPSTSQLNPIPIPDKHIKGGPEDIPSLRTMILDPDITPSSTADVGKYIAIDCEMVGVGPVQIVSRWVHGSMVKKEETESSLARVSLVNYHGVVVLDAFVKQKEAVTDFRTEFSGVRPHNLVGPDAMTFEEVQKMVAGIIKGRNLVGHAVQNDLKALLLKHPKSRTRDTQSFALIREEYKTKKPALRVVIQKEFDLAIQAGEHSSVTDARATMALYRLYKARWDVMLPASAWKMDLPQSAGAPVFDDWAEEDDDVSLRNLKRKVLADDDEEGDENEEDDDAQPVSKRPRGGSSNHPPPTPGLVSTQALKAKKQVESFPGGGRRGISSGLSTIVRGGGAGGRKGSVAASGQGQGGDWWKSLNKGGAAVKGKSQPRR